eukprot:309858-Pyramimonas_sp.AAC.1
MMRCAQVDIILSQFSWHADLVLQNCRGRAVGQDNWPPPAKDMVQARTSQPARYRPMLHGR